MVSSKRTAKVHLWAAMLVLSFCTSHLHAAEPVVRTLNLRGLQVGGTTSLILDGDDLAGARLLLPFPARQELKPGSTAKKAMIDVQLDADVPPGFYQFWVVTEGGVGPANVIAVDRLPQQVFTPAVQQLPIALHGTLAGAAVLETKFAGKAKQRVMVDVEAQRLGGKLRPIVHLLTPKKLQLAWSWGTPATFGDCRLEAVLPEDGTYTVTLHDAEYAGPAPGFFRLKIGAWRTVDQVFPPVLARGRAQTVELLGSSPPVRVEVPAPRNVGVLQLPWPKEGLWSGPRPFVMVSPHAEFVNEAGKLQELPDGAPGMPRGVSGRLVTPFGEDRYRLAVTPGKKIKLEVFAERIGSPLDAALVVRNEKGDQLVRVEDSPGTLDPVLEYAVPDKVKAIIVGVVDAQGRGGPRSIYRLVIDPQIAGAVQGSFKLSTTTPRLAIPVLGRVVMPVFVERRGYQGQIDLSAALPAGVRMEGGLIPQGADGTLITLERGEAPFAAVITTWRGKTADGTEQPVVLKGHPLEKLQPWLATEIPLAASNIKASDFVVDWGNLPKDAGLVPGRKLVLPVKTARIRDKTTVKLTLLTSQLPPLANNQPDPNRTVRQEKPIEVAVNLPGADVTVLVPPELPATSYDVTVQAELLAADKKVLATVYAPVRRLPVRMPLVVELAGPNRIEAVVIAKKGPTMVMLKGKVERREGLQGEVAVALAGLPAGITAAPVTVKADASEFTLNVVLPANLAAGEIKGLKLSASAAVDAKTPNVRVKSRDVDVTLVVTAAK